MTQRLLCLALLASPALAKPPPWRGSSITVSNIVSLNSFDEAAEPDYNPYYALQTTFAPQWWLTDVVFLRGSLSLSREFTDSDVTTQADETVPSDISLGVGARLWTIPVVGINTSAGFDLRLPTSPYSQAQTLQVALSPSVSLSRTFPQALGLGLRYGLGFTRNFHEYTTGELDASPIPGCRPGQLRSCDSFLSTGVRNARSRISQSGEISLAPWSWVSAAAGVAVIYDYLYAPEKTEEVTFESQQDQGNRTFIASSLELSFMPWDALTISLIAAASNAQRKPTGQNEDLFINRNTELALDLRLDVAALAAPWMEE